MGQQGTRGERLQAALAAEIRAEMGVKKISKTELARRVGISHQSVLRKIYEDSRDIQIPELDAFAEALGMDPFELLRRAYARIGVEDVQ